MFRNIPFLLVALLVTQLTLAQKKEKIKGSKIVTVAVKEINTFENIEVNDNFEVFLVKSDSHSLEIEADDNLHDIINFEVSGNTLRVTALKTPSSFKKFAVRINYSDSLKLITARNEAQIKALADLKLEKITIKNYDYSKSFLNVRSDYFALVLDDKSEAEINVKASSVTLELSKNAELKALIDAPEAKIDLYQKSKATIEGSSETVKMRLDNNANLIAPKYKIKELDLTAEHYVKCKVHVLKEITIEASGKSEIELVGDAKINLNKFINNAILSKKEK
ncbi:GIN domain-containing protein [Flavobacterium ardleyense]|uniref:GIN domain-containing protein n=1 Tax=Flavobacterium ardleyense TaxID=2038737 RepID=A0ABW5ZB11_9FLAO